MSGGGGGGGGVGGGGGGNGSLGVSLVGPGGLGQGGLVGASGVVGGQEAGMRGQSAGGVNGGHGAWNQHEGGRGAGGVTGGQGSGMRYQTGLNPSRVRGFNGQYTANRFETPSLNEMRAKQGAIVAKFMTFFKRKSTLVIEMYETSFYRQKPNWDKIADFIHNDLCNTSELRKGVMDVQFHPVKMLLFIRFSEESLRDATVARLQSAEGVTWSDYRVKVKGYSLDAQVKFIRLLGVSPETEVDEIKTTFFDLGIGEVMEIKKGLLDAGRLPGVTNGTWILRVKILDPDKVIPSYIHRRDEGELWSLNFEGRVFCCWKCGSGYHIGDKCRDQTRTFDEIFSGVDNHEGEFVKPTWAAVVRSGQGESEAHLNKVNEMESKLKEDNQRKDREKKELDNQKRMDEEEDERLRQKEAVVRQNAIDVAALNARQAQDDTVYGLDKDHSVSDNEGDISVDMLTVVKMIDEQDFDNGVIKLPGQDADAGDRAKSTYKIWSVVWYYMYYVRSINQVDALYPPPLYYFWYPLY